MSLRPDNQSGPMVGGNPPNNSQYGELFVEKNVQVLVEALAVCGFDITGYSTKPTIDHYRKNIIAMRGDWLGFMKWKIASYIAIGHNHEPPTKPEGVEDDPAVLLGGRAMQWLKLIRRTRPERFQQILCTLDTVKRAMQRPDSKALRAAERKAYIALTTERERISEAAFYSEEQLWEPIPSVGPDPESVSSADMEREVERTAREIAQEMRNFTWEDTLRPFFPSTKANYLTTRSKGGAVGYIMHSKELESLKASDQELITWKEEGRGIRSRRVTVDDSNLNERWRQLYEKLVQAAIKEEKNVTLVALAEALKVRVISKGPVATYTVLKPVQKWMWNALRSHSSGAFKLIGEEITSAYMIEQLGQLREQESYLSGDYSAATDNLDPKLSAIVVRVLGERIDDRRLRELFLDSLIGHKIRNPDDPNQLTPQKWGQLMGSIVSFPILCIVNAAICRYARERSVRRKLRLVDAKIACNGDDCSFRANRVGQRAWENAARATGMAPSMGKYFFSSEFIQMNSAQFQVVSNKPEESDLNPLAHTLELVPKVNMGLLAGLGRTTGSKVEKGNNPSNWGSLNSISINSHTLINECAAEDKERVFKIYLNKNWEKLKSTRLPWFLPEHLGGLGLPIFPEYKTIVDGQEKKPWVPTTLDLRLAASVYKHGRNISKRPEGVDWKVWEYAQKRIKHFPQTINQSYEFHTSNGSEGPENQSYESIMGKLCIESIFTQPFNKVYRESREQNLTLRKVEKELQRCMKFMGEVEPFTVENLPKVPNNASKLNYGLISSSKFQATALNLNELFFSREA